MTATRERKPLLHEITLIADKPGICIMLPCLSFDEALDQNAALTQAGYSTYWYDPSLLDGDDHEIAAHFEPAGWKPTAHAV